MKSILAPILLTTILSLNLVSIKKVEEVYCVNENNIEITKENYDKLIRLGYTPREIKFLKYKEYNEKINYKIQNTILKKYIQKTPINAGEQKEFSPELVNIKKMALMDTDYNENIEFCKSTKKNSAYQDQYKEVSFFGSTIKDEMDNIKFFVKVNVDWISAPQERLNDFISLVFSDAVQIESNNSNIIFDSSFIYTKYVKAYYSTSLGVVQDYVDTQEYINTVDGNSIGSYKYNVGNSLVVKYDLPPEDAVMRRYENNSYYEYLEIYSNFSFSLSALFLPTTSAIISAPFAGIYAHEKQTIELTFNELEFSLTEPFVTSSVSLGLSTYYEVVSSYIVLDKTDIMWPVC